MNASIAIQAVPIMEKYPYLIPIIVAAILLLTGFALSVIIWRGIRNFNRTVDENMNKFKDDIDKNIETRFRYISDDIKAIKECNQDMLGRAHYYKLLFDKQVYFETLIKRESVFDEIYQEHMDKKNSSKKYSNL